mmetsp:Transcript_21084/g.67949  ORF Transcript_21084/g.67949 Transcript_21084/m.67949 type:complete len:689 (+) Transcript_21084:1720-3786(+)
MNWRCCCVLVSSSSASTAILRYVSSMKTSNSSSTRKGVSMNSHIDSSKASVVKERSPPDRLRASVVPAACASCELRTTCSESFSSRWLKSRLPACPLRVRRPLKSSAACLPLALQLLRQNLYRSSKFSCVPLVVSLMPSSSSLLRTDTSCVLRASSSSDDSVLPPCFFSCFLWRACSFSISRLISSSLRCCGSSTRSPTAASTSGSSRSISSRRRAPSFFAASRAAFASLPARSNLRRPCLARLTGPVRASTSLDFSLMSSLRREKRSCTSDVSFLRSPSAASSLVTSACALASFSCSTLSDDSSEAISLRDSSISCAAGSNSPCSTACRARAFASLSCFCSVLTSFLPATSDLTSRSLARSASVSRALHCLSSSAASRCCFSRSRFRCETSAQSTFPTCPSQGLRSSRPCLSTAYVVPFSMTTDCTLVGPPCGNLRRVLCSASRASSSVGMSSRASGWERSTIALKAWSSSTLMTSRTTSKRARCGFCARWVTSMRRAEKRASRGRLNTRNTLLREGTLGGPGLSPWASLRSSSSSSFSATTNWERPRRPPSAASAALANSSFPAFILTYEPSGPIGGERKDLSFFLTAAISSGICGCSRLETSNESRSSPRRSSAICCSLRSASVTSARLASIPSIAASCCRLLACSACCFSPIARCSAATSSSASSRSRSSAARCVCWFFSRSSR